MPRLGFKSPTHCCEFNQKVHNLLLEAVSEKDHILFAHLAGDEEESHDVEPDMYANVVDCDGDAVEDTGDFGDEEDSAAMAFAVLGLASLNWKAA